MAKVTAAQDFEATARYAIGGYCAGATCGGLAAYLSSASSTKVVATAIFMAPYTAIACSLSYLLARVMVHNNFVDNKNFKIAIIGLHAISFLTMAVIGVASGAFTHLAAALVFGGHAVLSCVAIPIVGYLIDSCANRMATPA